MDSQRLMDALAVRFDGTEPTLRAIARQARDLDDSGRIEADMGYRLTVEAVVSNLADAPAEYSLLERWNWWIGSLELAFGAYQRFHVRPDLEDHRH